MSIEFRIGALTIVYIVKDFGELWRVMARYTKEITTKENANLSCVFLTAAVSGMYEGEHL
jgi:hypothetical protein